MVWPPRTGNPASHQSLKYYLRFLYQQQASSHVSLKQSVPLFGGQVVEIMPSSQRSSICFLWYYSPESLDFVRDPAFFCVYFFSSDRASDLRRTLTKEVLSLPDNQGFIFRQSVGYTLRGKVFHVFAIKSCSNPFVFPVSTLCSVMKAAQCRSSREVPFQGNWQE